jgi:DNA-binding NtrC family response regulator
MLLNGTSERSRRAEPGTAPLDPRQVPRARFALVMGRGTLARALPLDRRPVSIGLAEHNQLRLTDTSVSRSHCLVEPTAFGVLVRDLGSTNGTWVDGIRVDSVELRKGASLRLGRTEMAIVARAQSGRDASTGSFVAESPAMLSVLADVERFASLPWPVLICGETGVGKEEVARALHQNSPRRAGPFVAVNAGGLPTNLVESELFGHQKGAFTGAVRTYRGAFERAHGGTLFLDEIGELPPTLQTRLLRVLETWRVRRVGGDDEIDVDVRLLCATHRDLGALVASGGLRSDFFYRIHRLTLEVPPLRSRPVDLGALSQHFLRSMPAGLGPKSLSKEARRCLAAQRWPGNVRELRNVLELAAAQSSGPVIELAEVHKALGRFERSTKPAVSPETLRKALERHGGNASAAARALGMPRSTFRDRLQEAG